MKKVSSGFYEIKYKGKLIQVIKVPELNCWYSLIDGRGGDDFYTYKSSAFWDAKYFIDNEQEYR